MISTPAKHALQICLYRYGAIVEHRSGHTKTGETIILTFPAQGGYQLALRDNKKKLTCYVNGRTRGGESVRNVLPSGTLLEEIYPSGEYRVGDKSRKPANSLLSLKNASMLTPRTHELLRLAVAPESFEELLKAYLSISAVDKETTPSSSSAKTIYRDSGGTANGHYASLINDVSQQIARDYAFADTREVDAIVKVRVGQGIFRQFLIQLHEPKCWMSGLSDPRLLIASHIKPWSRCKDDTGARGDPENGLLLSVHWDALFDKGLITFSESGRLIVGGDVGPDVLGIMNIDFAGQLADRYRTPRRMRYLQFHREHIFQAWVR